MPGSQSESEKPSEVEKQDGVPKWIKATGAVIGVIATAAGIFTGIYSLATEIQKERTAQEKERTAQAAQLAEAEKERTEQVRLENEAKERELEARITEAKAKLQIEEEKTLQQAAARETAELEVSKQKMQEASASRALEREQRGAEQKRLFEAISNLVGSKEPSLGALLTISQFADTDIDNRNLIIRTLSTHAERSCSPSELNLAFLSLRKIGPESLQEAINLNRLGVKRFRSAIEKYFLVRLADLEKWEDYDRNNLPPSASLLAICRSIVYSARRSEAMDFRAQAYLILAYWAKNKALLSDDQEINLDSIELLEKELLCASELITGSNKVILRLLPYWDQSEDKIDLTDTYLEADAPLDSILPAGTSIPMRGAYVVSQGEALATWEEPIENSHVFNEVNSYCGFGLR